MSGSSSPWQANAVGWEVIDEALDGVRRAAFAANSPRQFQETLTQCLRPVGIFNWSIWMRRGGRWTRQASGDARASVPDSAAIAEHTLATEPAMSAELAGSAEPARSVEPARSAESARSVEPARSAESVNSAESALVAAAWEANATRSLTLAYASSSASGRSFRPGSFNSSAVGATSDTTAIDDAHANNAAPGPANTRVIGIAAPYGKADLVGGVLIAWRELPDSKPAIPPSSAPVQRAPPTSVPPRSGLAMSGFARLVEALAEEVRVFETRQALRDAVQERARHERLHELLVALHGSLSLATTLQVLANEVRIIAACDRVAVSLAAGRRQKLEAVSNTEHPHRQSAVRERLEPLCSVAAALGEPLWLGNPPIEGNARDNSAGPARAAPSTELPDELAALWDAYLEVSPCQSLVILPLRLPSSLAGVDDSVPVASRASDALDLEHGATASLSNAYTNTNANANTNACEGIVFGTLVCERMGKSWEPWAPDLLRRLATHAATALAQARVVSYIPGHRLWLRWAAARGRRAGRGGLWASGLGPRGLLATVGIGVVIALLAWIPAELEVRAAGELRSVTRRELFAPADGIVAELRIDHGQQVRKNDLLLVVHSPELDRQWQEAHSVADGLQRQLASVQSQRLQARAGDTASRQRAAALAAEEEQLLTQRKSQLELVALLEDRRESLQVRSPMAGRIITWGVRDRLAGRPLRRGDPLLTIAGDGGPFELELRVPERVAGRVLAAAQGETGGHRVAWTLASRPETPRHGTVCELSRRIDFDSLGGGFLRVRVALAEDQELETAPRELGETVAAKVACGRVSLAESWFFELIDTARRWWWL